jgi:hypothetical protein
MPIFRLDGDKLIIAQETNLELEKHLEDWLENSPWAVIDNTSCHLFDIALLMKIKNLIG